MCPDLALFVRMICRLLECRQQFIERIVEQTIVIPLFSVMHEVTANLIVVEKEIKGLV